MENLDIIVLSSIVIGLFGIFIFMVYKELSKPEDTYVLTEDNSPRTRMIKSVGTIFDTVPQTPNRKKTKSKPKEEFFKLENE